MSNLEITKINELAERINAEHDKCLEGIKLGLLHAINVGELLKETKPLIGHGDWLNWIKDNCNFSERTAQNYIRMADNKTELLNTKRVAHLSYRDAIKLLAEPIPEEEPKEYEPHELNNIFPRDEWVINTIEKELENGSPLCNPITLYEGKILDGKLRYEACKRAGIIPIYKTFPDDYPGYHGSAQDFVFSSNMKRQHLNESQRAVIAVDMMDEFKAQLEQIKTPEEALVFEKEAERRLNALLEKYHETKQEVDDSITDYQSMFGEAKGQAYKYIVLSQRQGYIRVTPQSFEILPRMENEKRFNVHTWAGIVGELLILHGKGKANAPDNVKWWLGDCLNYGEKKWPKEWKKALNGSYLIAEIFTKHPGAKVEEVIEHLVTEKAIVDK